jgi:hypothetical protein
MHSRQSPGLPSLGPTHLYRRWADRAGAALSLGCAVHCAGTAMALIAWPALWLQLRYRHPEWLWLFSIEDWLAYGSIVCGALVIALRRHHRGRLRWSEPLLLAGICGLLLGLLWPELRRSFWSVPVVSGSALLLLAGHLLDLRAPRRTAVRIDPRLS